MTLDRLSQITEVGIKSGITLRNINVEGAYVSGVVTATTLNADNYIGNATGRLNPSALNVTGVTTFQGNVFHGDGDIAYFGDGNDLLIFHNSTDSIIRDNGTGDLFIEGGNRIRLTNPTGIETYAVFNQDGAVELYFDNVKRFETTGVGVSVYGGVIVTGVTTVAAGSTSAPSISPSGDSNTGIFFPSADTVCIAEGGVESARFDSSGRFGIGTQNPSTTLHTLGGTASGSSTINYNLRLSTGTTGSQAFGGVGNGIYLDSFTNSGTQPVAAVSSSLDSGGSGGASTNYSGHLLFYTKSVTDSNPIERARVDSSGNVQIANGNLVFSTAGKGIDFSATSQASGMTGEILSDYEEGTWTPVLKGAAGAGSWSGSSANGGFYIKVGRQVTCWANVNGTLSSASGDARVAGLPFTRNLNSTPSAIGNAPYSTGAIQYWSGISVQSMGPLIDTLNELYFHTYATNSTSGSVVVAVNGSHNLHFFITYFTAS